jgi:hypothetical protein
MLLLEMIDLRDVVRRMGQLKGDALAVPAGWEAPALDHGDLVRALSSLGFGHQEGLHPGQRSPGYENVIPARFPATVV